MRTRYTLLAVLNFYFFMSVVFEFQTPSSYFESTGDSLLEVDVPRPALFRPRAEEVFSENGSLMPSFIIIGAEKSGTTSLYTYLTAHPQVLPLKNRNVTSTDPPVMHNGFNQTAFVSSSKRVKRAPVADLVTAPGTKHRANPFLEGKLKALGNKEIRFFGTGKYRNDTTTTNAYLEYFHKKGDPEFKAKVRPVVTGEASPGYIFSPASATQIHDMFPNIKIIALLRNPIDRALSHFYHTLLSRNQSMPVPDINEVVKAELGVLARCTEKFPSLFSTDEVAVQAEFMSCHTKEMQAVLNGAPRDSFWRHQLIIRGLYAPQIIPYLKVFQRERLMFIKSEDLYSHTESVMNKVSSFLDLHVPHDWARVAKKKFNFGEKNRVSSQDASLSLHDNNILTDDSKQEIQRFIFPFNQRLIELVDIRWD